MQKPINMNIICNNILYALQKHIISSIQETITNTVPSEELDVPSEEFFLKSC